jgi:hypothetical protein
MATAVEVLIERLRQTVWFAQVGQPVEKGLGVVVRLPDWDAALKYCDGRGWLRITQQESDRLYAGLESRFGLDAIEGWNSQVRIWRPVVQELIARQTAELPLSPDLLKRVHHAASYDLTTACVECEYQTVLDSMTGFDIRFFRRIAEWYCRGRFPCGWLGGVPPEGHLVLY